MGRGGRGILEEEEEEEEEAKIEEQAMTCVTSIHVKNKKPRADDNQFMLSMYKQNRH